MQYLFNLPIWVKWKFEEVPLSGRKTKVPYQINGYKASPVAPSQWSTFEEINKIKEGFDGIGFIISKEYPLLCIDLDHVLKEGKLKREDYEILVETANTYTELSPSKEGLHIIFRIKEFFPLLKNRHNNTDGTGIEAYTENRYFTYTGESFGDTKPIRTINQEEAEELLRMVGYPWGIKKTINAIKTEEILNEIPSDILLKKIFKSKGGGKIERLYNGDISDYNNDNSAADAAFITNLAFWTRKNSAQIEEIWLNSPLGQREKTQKREDYRRRTIDNILPLISKVYEPKGTKTTARPFSLVNPNAPSIPVLINEIVFNTENSEKGIPHKNIPNVEKILEADSYLTNSFRYNSFSETVESNIENGSDWLPLQISHETLVAKYIQATYSHFELVTENIVRQAISVYSRRFKVNPPVEMITSVKWDGEERIKFWLEKTFGLEPNELNQSISANWIKGLVNRVVTPGCQFDTVLVIEGKQGVGKSSVFRALAEPWYAETTIDVSQKDFVLILMRNIVVEFSEGATLSRSDSKTLKNIITVREDDIRRPYDRESGKYPRRCVFAMTTNEEQYLKDETGNRRWLPVNVGENKADVNWIKDNRLQLFAEAYHKVYELGEKTYEFASGLEEEQESRMEEDPWIQSIVNWYFDELSDQNREDGVTTLDAYSKALWTLTSKEFTSGQGRRVGSIFRNVLKLYRKQLKINKTSSWRFFATDETNKLNQERNESLTETEIKEKAYKESRRFYETTKSNF